MSAEETRGDENAANRRRTSRIIIGVGFLLLVLAAVCTIGVSVSEEQTSRVALRSRGVRDLKNALFTAVQDAETGQRGYLLTGDQTYLAPFMTAQATIPDLEARLVADARGNPAQVARLARIRALVDEKIGELARTVDLRLSGHAEAALEVVKSNHGRDVMDRIRRESAAFERVERRLADQRRVEQSARRRLLIWIMVGALLLVALLSAFFAVEERRYASVLATQNGALRREAAERARAEAQLRQAQKMEALGQLTGGIAHDFNNMLAIVIGNLDMIIRRLSQGDDRLRLMAENALSGANKAANLTRRLLAFSRLQPLNPMAADVNRCVGDLSEMLRRTLGEQIAIETVLGGGVWRAFVDTPQLESAILNLAVNARDAMPGGGRLTIETSNAALDRAYGDKNDVEPGQYILVAVTDTGVGMEPAVMEKAFDPFFTTKPVGAGTGLGLSQVHGFVKQSRGHIQIYSEVGHGTSIKLYLPRAAADAQTAEPESSQVSGRRHLGSTILVVEDDEEVRRFATSAARELGFTVVEAANGPAALVAATTDPSISLVLTDVIMPGMTGRELVDQILARRPGLPVVYMTGYTRNAIVHNGALDTGTRLLTKPFNLDELDRELNDALSSADPG